MKRGCTTLQRAVTSEAKLEPPVSLGEKMKNWDFDGFLKSVSFLEQRKADSN